VRAVGAACAVATLAAPGCRPDPGSDTGATAVAGSHRVVSLVPAASEIVVALGAAGRVVGRAADDPTPGLEGVPEVGRVLAPSVECVVALRPDLVLIPPEAPPGLAELLRRRPGVRVDVVTIHRLADVTDAVRAVGEVLGLEVRADALARAIGAELEAVRAAARGRPRVRTVWIVSVEPLVAAGPGTYLDDLLLLAGGNNVLADADAAWPRPSLESLAASAPAVVLWSAGPPPPAGTSPLAGLPALRERRLRVVDPELFHRPGPGVGRRAGELAALLHPWTGGPGRGARAVAPLSAPGPPARGVSPHSLCPSTPSESVP
jgi:iron complex transport system substrate-binding protein